MNFKRKSPTSRNRCPICCGQRRHFGWGNQKTKALMKVRAKEFKETIASIGMQ